MKSVITAVSVFALLAFASLGFGQVQPANPFPDQFVAAGIGYNQNAVPQQIQGGLAYAKLLSASAGSYSYTSVYESSVNLKPKFGVQTQTQTGACVFTLSFAGFDTFSCLQAGLATAGGSTGVAATGTFLAMKPVGKKGWRLGFTAAPSYSGATNAVSYAFGIIGGWGK